MSSLMSGLPSHSGRAQSSYSFLRKRGKERKTRKGDLEIDVIKGSGVSLSVSLFFLEVRMLDFELIKKTPIPQILSRYGIRLRYRGEYGNAPCPLPTHKEKDKAKT